MRASSLRPRILHYLFASQLLITSLAVSASGQGAPLFTEVLYSAGSAPGGVALADLNGDGKLDLATANYSSDNVGVLINVCLP